MEPSRRAASVRKARRVAREGKPPPKAGTRNPESPEARRERLLRIRGADEFSRFETFTGKLLKVPKAEIDRLRKR